MERIDRKKRSVVFGCLLVAGLVIGAFCSALIFQQGSGKVQAAFQGTDYPAPLPTNTFDSSYPGPATPTQQGTVRRTPTALTVTPGSQTPTSERTPDSSPNLFLTEDAQMGDSRVTPGLQTLGPTSTPSGTPTPLPTATLTATPEPSATPAEPTQTSLDGPIIWPLVAVGFILPTTLLSFGVLAITVARELQRTS